MQVTAKGNPTKRDNPEGKPRPTEARSPYPAVRRRSRSPVHCPGLHPSTTVSTPQRKHHPPGSISHLPHLQTSKFVRLLNLRARFVARPDSIKRKISAPSYIYRFGNLDI